MIWIIPSAYLLYLNYQVIRYFAGILRDRFNKEYFYLSIKYTLIIKGILWVNLKLKGTRRGRENLHCWQCSSICEGREFIARPAWNKCPIEHILLKL